MGFLQAYLFFSAIAGFAIAFFSALMATLEFYNWNSYYIYYPRYKIIIIEYINHNAIKTIIKDWNNVIFAGKIIPVILVLPYFIFYSVVFPIMIGVCLIPAAYLYIFRVREDKVEK
jgi:hypothetical protein